MSLLRVHRKAADETDARKLVKATYRLTDPFGVPTLFLRPEEFGGLNKLFVFNKVRRALKSFEKNKGLRNLSNDIGLIINTSITLSKSLTPEKDGGAHCFWIWGNCPHHAHHYEPGDYDNPYAAIICSPLETQNIEKLSRLATKSFSAFVASNLPCTDSEEQFYTLWHELGHAAGGFEPQAETTAAVMSRKSFTNTSFLTVQSDFRAFHAVNTHSDNKRVKTYGWPMVDALDYIRSIPEEAIDAITSEQVKQLRHLRFEYHATALQQAGRLVKEEGLRLNRVDYPEIVRNILSNNDNASLDPVVTSILMRFSLAANRLTAGAKAYKDTRLEKKIWDEGYQFHTLPKDVPEFLPDPSSLSPV